MEMSDGTVAEMGDSPIFWLFRMIRGYVLPMNRGKLSTGSSSLFGCGGRERSRLMVERYLGRIQGMLISRRRQSLMVAACRWDFVAAAQRSSWFPDEPHLKLLGTYRAK